jgi:hypothetical protein
MSDTNDDPVLAHLLARRAGLAAALAHTTARLAEVDLMISTLGDGRTRVRRRIKAEPQPGLSIPEPTEAE